MSSMNSRQCLYHTQAIVLIACRFIVTFLRTLIFCCHYRISHVSSSSIPLLHEVLPTYNLSLCNASLSVGYHDVCALSQYLRHACMADGDPFFCRRLQCGEGSEASDGSADGPASAAVPPAWLSSRRRRRRRTDALQQPGAAAGSAGRQRTRPGQRQGGEDMPTRRGRAARGVRPSLIV